MLYYDRNDINKGIDHTKNNRSKECMICHYWVFNHWFNFEGSVCNVFHELMILCLNIIDIAVIIVINVDYRCIIHNISKSRTINLLKSSELENVGYI